MENFRKPLITQNVISRTQNGTALLLVHCIFRICTHPVTTFGHPTQIFTVTSAYLQNTNFYYFSKTFLKLIFHALKQSFQTKKKFHVGRDSVVDIATSYRPEGPGIEPRCWWLGWEIFRTRPDRPWGTPRLLYNEYRVFPGGKVAGLWRWPPTPNLARRVKKEYKYKSSPPLCLHGSLTGGLFICYFYAVLISLWRSVKMYYEQSVSFIYIYFLTNFALPRYFHSFYSCDLLFY
jgi:hypothetical protein